MSEYEYYEFQAIDRPLSANEIRALRAISSRATITPTHFSNVYNFGSLKASPHDLLARYFDAFVYLANWRYRELAFRFPRSSFDAKTARLYKPSNGLTVRTQGACDLVIVSAESPDDENEFEDDEGRGWLSTLAGLRADLAAGDHRLLYLAWLMGVQAGDTDDAAVEPPCPPGLKDLSGALEAFVDFVWLDPDLVAAAAEGSQSLKETSDTDFQQWIASLSDTEKTQLLVRAARRDGAVAAELSVRFRRVTKVTQPPVRGRRVSELRASAERRAAERQRAEEERAADADRSRKAEEQRVRADYLDALAQRQDATWREVEQLIGSHQPRSYVRATTLLVDLRDVAERAGRGDAFALQLAALRARHAAKPAFQSRLRAAGLDAAGSRVTPIKHASK
jgi:hypothetical protein